MRTKSASPEAYIGPAGARLLEGDPVPREKKEEDEDQFE
jgi:hypothetical protein